MTAEDAKKLIAGRITDEFRKHSGSIEGWADIAAGKIYSQWFEFYQEKVESLQSQLAEKSKECEELIALFNGNDPKKFMEIIKKHSSFELIIENYMMSNELTSLEKQVEEMQLLLDDAQSGDYGFHQRFNERISQFISNYRKEAK